MQELPSCKNSLWPASLHHKSPHQIFIRESQYKFDHNKHRQGVWAEELVEALFLSSGWNIYCKRYRGRGFELDLVVLSPCQTQLRIIEIKSFRRLTQASVINTRNSVELPLEVAHSLLSPKKIAALQRGANTLISKIALDGKSYDSSLDLVLVIPFHAEDKHLVTTWMNVGALK